MPNEDNNHSNIIEWKDAQIRWTDSSVPSLQQQQQQDDDDDDEDETPPDLFAPNPHTTFTFQNIQLHGYTYESDQTWNSTGLTLWRASEYLCRSWLFVQPSSSQSSSSSSSSLSSSSQFWKDKRVLELGAGLGLCGIVAHQLGAQTVYVTDGDSDVLPVLISNIQNNRLVTSLSNEQQQQKQHISGHQLLWGKEYAPQFLTKIAHIEQQQQHQTIIDQDSSSFLWMDIILAADVIYVPQIIVPLLETVSILLKPNTGIFVLAFAKRMVDVTVQDVLQQATQMGFMYEQWSTETDTQQGLYLYTFRKDTPQ